MYAVEKYAEILQKTSDSWDEDKKGIKRVLDYFERYGEVETESTGRVVPPAGGCYTRSDANHFGVPNAMALKCSRYEEDREACQEQWREIETVFIPGAYGEGARLPETMLDLSQNLCSYIYQGEFGWGLEELGEIGIRFAEFYHFMGCNPLIQSMNQKEYRQVIDIIEQLEREGATREFINEAIYGRNASNAKITRPDLNARETAYQYAERDYAEALRSIQEDTDPVWLNRTEVLDQVLEYFERYREP